MDDGHNNTPVCCCNIHNKGAQLLLKLCSYFYVGPLAPFYITDEQSGEKKSTTTKFTLKSQLKISYLSFVKHPPVPPNIFLNMWCSVTITHRVFTGDCKEGPWEPWLWLQRVRRAPGEGRLRQHDPPAWPRWAGRLETLWSYSSGTTRKLWKLSKLPHWLFCQGSVSLKNKLCRSYRVCLALEWGKEFVQLHQEAGSTRWTLKKFH